MSSETGWTPEGMRRYIAWKRDLRDAYLAGVAKQNAREAALRREGRLVPTQWEDRPQKYALGCLIFDHVMKTCHGVRIDFGRPGDHNIAIIREPQDLH